MWRKANASRQKADVQDDWKSEFRRRRQQSLFALLDMVRYCRFEEGGGRHCGLIAIGQLEGLPYCISSLADTLGEPRSTTSRKLRILAKQGLVKFEPKRGAKQIVLTDKGWVRLGRWWRILDGPIDHFVAVDGALRHER
jgi:hypothetical protein